MVAILLLIIPPAHAATQGTVQAIIPWEGEGRVFQVDSSTVMFLGALKGVVYIENSSGEMHEAFVVCPIKQEFDLKTGATEAIGSCEITASADTIAYAKLSCDGMPGDFWFVCRFMGAGYLEI